MRFLKTGRSPLASFRERLPDIYWEIFSAILCVTGIYPDPPRTLDLRFQMLRDIIGMSGLMRPIGYIAATSEWCDTHAESLDSWWRDATAEIHHFIGKDIIYFHTLFWPAMLHAAGLSLPTKVRIHGFLTVNGQKMSKSRGTFIMARSYLDHLDPGMLRYLCIKTFWRHR